ncbi:hypothetical protein NC651_033338 [Populus alba x Populus x berolinensis]|nr:hypothetical protein NC651_033338 [Populus alba x Populus x berolinensis]
MKTPRRDPNNLSQAKNSSTVSFSLRTRTRWDTLFIPEEVVGINSGLHLHQSVEVTLEVLSTPNPCFFNTCVDLLVHAQIKVPVIEVCFPWILGNIRCHVLINLPSPINVRCTLRRIIPAGRVLKHEQDTLSMRKRSLRF